MSELVLRLATPFLPYATRCRLRQQRLDGEVAVVAERLLRGEGISVAVTRSDPGTWSPEPVEHSGFGWAGRSCS